MVDRIKHLGQFFALEVIAYAVMSNHFHMVIFYDPKAAAQWSDSEVAKRWVSAFPVRVNGIIDEGMQQLAYEELLEDCDKLRKKRNALGSLSSFMQHLKQFIAVMANKEAGTSGDFWANRFYSGALLDHDAVLAAMAYVDLNPVRAGITEHVGQYVNTSIFEQLQSLNNSTRKVDDYLKPIVTGLNDNPSIVDSTAPDARLRISLANYLLRLKEVVRALTRTQRNAEHSSRWISHVLSIRRPQRAYGNSQHLTSWLCRRHFRPLEQPLV